MAPSRKPRAENLSLKGGSSKTGKISTAAQAERKFPAGNPNFREGPPATERHFVKRLNLLRETQSKAKSSSSGSSGQELKGQPSTNGSGGQAEARPKRVASSKRQFAQADVFAPPKKKRRMRMPLKAPPTYTRAGASKPKVRVLKGRYTVERILDKKLEHGNAFYLVKWKNFKPSGNTWEPLHHFSSELIRQWEEERSGNQARYSATSSNPPSPPTNAAVVGDGQVAGPSRVNPATASSGNRRDAAFPQGDYRTTDAGNNSSGEETEACDEASNDSDDSYSTAITTLSVVRGL